MRCVAGADLRAHDCGPILSLILILSQISAGLKAVEADATARRQAVSRHRQVSPRPLDGMEPERESAGRTA